MKNTEEQDAIIQAVKNKDCDIGPIAGAGCGKSTTAKLACLSVLEKKPVYLAFNRSIAQEFKEKCPEIESMTQHSFCLSLLRPIERFQMTNRYNNRDVQDSLGIDYLVASDVLRTITRFFQSAATKPELYMVAPLLRIADEKLRLEAREIILQYTIKFWEWIQMSRIYSHDAYIKVLQVVYPDVVDDRFGLIAVDEYQDTNPAFAAILDRHPQQKLCIGDPMQAIYQWRGAVDAFKTFKGERYHLSVSFRFPSVIADLANEIISYRETDFRLKGLAPMTELAGRHAYLHRSNTGCLQRAIGLRDSFDPFVLQGGVSAEEKSVLRDMQSLYFDHPEQIKTEDLRGLESFEDLQEIMAMEEDEFGEWTSRDRLIHSLGGYGRFTNELDSLEQESRRNEKNPKAAVVITAHKAKGLEYPSVTIGSDFVRKFTVSEEQEARTGIKYAINGGEIEEQNLLYVAVTRGMRSVDLREVEPLFPNRSVVGLPLPA